MGDIRRTCGLLGPSGAELVRLRTVVWAPLIRRRSQLTWRQLAGQTRMERPKVKIQTASKIKNLTSLVLRTLAIVVVSLTVFNLYLFAWLWSSLCDSQLTLRTGQWARLDLLESWQSAKISGKLLARGSLQAQRVLAKPGGRVSLSSSQSVHFQLSNNQCRLLELESRQSRIGFPNGASVQAGKTGLVCDAHNCTYRAPFIKFQSERLDFGRKWLQMNGRLLLRSRGRLHSATGQLRLLSANRNLFEAHGGHLNLSALDDIFLASRQSTLTLDTKSIDVSRVRSLASFARIYSNNNNNNTNRSGYKLCICLAGRVQTEPETTSSQRNSPRTGLVFGLNSRLSCASFGESFCQS